MTKHVGRYFRNRQSGYVFHLSQDPRDTMKTLGNEGLWEEVVISPAPKPVSGTVSIIRDSDGTYRAERGELLTNGTFLNLKFTDGEVVARLRWTEGDGM